MRIALIQISQETDTFNPLPTTLEDFAAFGLYDGPEMLRRRGQGVTGGRSAATSRRSSESGRDIETVPITRGLGVAGGRITTEALRVFRGSRAERARPPPGALDGLARPAPRRLLPRRAWTTSRAGCSRSAARCSGPSVPIVVTLDHHANVTQRMVDLSDAMVGYRTQPHDPFETGEAATRAAAPDRWPATARPDDGVAQDPAALAPGAVPDVGRADEDLVRPRPRARARSAASCRSRSSRCSHGSTSRRLAGRRSSSRTTTLRSPSGSPTSWPTSPGRCAPTFQVKTSIPPDEAVRTADAAGRGRRGPQRHGRFGLRRRGRRQHRARSSRCSGRASRVARSCR